MAGAISVQAEQLVREGRLDEALAALKEQVCQRPADPKLRVFLFQLLAVLGDWDRALTQLNLAADMEDSAVLMATMCRDALQCEALRTEVFGGRRTPLIFGEPPPWVGLMVEALRLTADGRHGQAQVLRDDALEQALAVSGQIDGRPFEWICDADVRLGPILEAVINGRYYWVPLQHITQLTIDAPANLRDMVWAQAQFVWTNGGQAAGLIPVRYPGSQTSADSAIRLARKTEWSEPEPETYLGEGQRMLATDEGEYPLLEIRRVAFTGNGGGATP